MARSKIDLDQLSWSDTATGSLAGPASFLGLSTDNVPVLVAAANYVSSGGGGGISFDGSTANGVLTFKDSDEATVESNLTFDGNTLTVSGDVNGSFVTVIDNDQGTNGHGLKVTSDGTGTGTNVLDVESASTTHFRIRGDGRIGMGKVTSLPSARLALSGSGSDVDLSIDEYIQHTGDPNTTIRFTDDQITFAAGGSEELKIASDAILVKQFIKHDGDEDTLINFADDKIILKAGNIAMITAEKKGSAPHEVTINDGSNNIDFVVKGNGSNQGNPGMKFDASENRLGINGVGSPAFELDVAGDIGLAEYIYHRTDTDTYVRFEDDTITLAAGGRDFIKIEEASQDRLTINNGGLDIDFKVSGENIANLIRTEASNDLVCIATGSSLVGTDTNFHVSGTIGGRAAGDRGVSVFAGDMVISGNLDVESKAHVMAGDASATSNAVSTLTLEDNDHAGLQFLTPNDKAGYILFGDPQSDFAGGIRYHHSDNSLAFKANGNYYFQITSDGSSKFSGSVELGDSVADNVFINGTLTGSNGIKLSGIPTGSLAGPASFLGIDNTDRVVQVAASDYVSAGGSDTFVTDNFGFFKFTNNNLHGHPTYVNNSRYNQINFNLSAKVTYGTDVDGSTFTSSIVNSILYIKNGIVPVACTLDSFTVQGYLVEAMSNGNAKFSLWKGAVPSDATAYTTNVTWTRMATVTWSGTGADDTWYKGTDSLSSSNSFAAGDWWAITVQPGGSDTSLSSGNSSYFASMVWSPT